MQVHKSIPGERWRKAPFIQWFYTETTIETTGRIHISELNSGRFLEGTCKQHKSQKLVRLGIRLYFHAQKRLCSTFSERATGLKRAVYMLHKHNHLVNNSFALWSVPRPVSGTHS